MLMYSLRRTPSSKNSRKQISSIISKRNSSVTSINHTAVLSTEIHLLGMSWMWQGIAQSFPPGSPSPRRSWCILELRVHPWWLWPSTVTTDLVPLQLWWALWPSYPQCLITERILTSSHSTHTHRQTAQDCFLSAWTHAIDAGRCRNSRPHTINKLRNFVSPWTPQITFEISKAAVWANLHKDTMTCLWQKSSSFSAK